MFTAKESLEHNRVILASLKERYRNALIVTLGCKVAGYTAVFLGVYGHEAKPAVAMTAAAIGLVVFGAGEVAKINEEGLYKQYDAQRNVVREQQQGIDFVAARAAGDKTERLVPPPQRAPHPLISLHSFNADIV